MDERQDIRQDHLIMQDGRVMMIRKGEMMLMEEAITLPDGTKVAVNGTVLMPDGTTRMMAEGEIILLQAEPAGPEDLPDQQFKEAMEDEELRDELP
jgi:hypothetical protein